MKPKLNRSIVFFIFISFLFGCGHSTNVSDEIDTYDEWELGKHQPYDFKSVKALPEGYAVDYVGYLSRHGSRYMLEPKEDVVLYNLFENAKLNDGLKKQGKHIFEEIKLLVKYQHNKYGDLSEIGKKEHKVLGQRMGKLCEDYFNNEPKIKSTSTFKSRTQDSRTTFHKGLQSKGYHPKFVNITYDEFNDPILRAFKICPNYNQYIDSLSWLNHIQEYQKTTAYIEVRNRILNSLFKKSYLQYLDEKQKRFYDNEHNLIIANKDDIIYNLFKCFKITRNLQLESHPNLEIFSAEDSKILTRIDDIHSFFEKGPGYEGRDISYKHGITFLKYLHTNMNDFVNGKSDYAGNFNFAHTNTVLPVLVLLNLDKIGERSLEEWNETEISTMATNISWILLNKGGERYIQIRWNEQSVSLPLEDQNDHIYKYDDYNNYMESILTSYGLNVHRGNYNDILFSI
ncbi:histidine phosphatase family protein [Flammeovirga yaeyamensis]|uniref:Multiple inositol polyphosphate phosphatase 1 n=1 Tax=Flammeovirga yaeyamensis TaxID=367791 RepID=A0AAX1N3G6_9BACT|nr:histidine-type phosphatase [Flammeovirga yaeyamensis]MBB3700862.1 hypothetical protein [Flammeovirga yaeyamensis]NMF37970.1 histidine phosphatase family protein [Flammeovirga yaeyamensis]QWG00622.1 histidine phosphatase family protein [Flammeovirga yaeyamensis]